MNKTTNSSVLKYIFIIDIKYHVVFGLIFLKEKNMNYKLLIGKQSHVN